MARRVVAALAALVVANAAVPDLPADARESTAELILVGKITSATAEDVSRREGHVDSVSIGQFAVSKVEKGEAPDTQTVYWWAPKARPDGWTGHQGQRPAPPAKKSPSAAPAAKTKTTPLASTKSSTSKSLGGTAARAA